MNRRKPVYPGVPGKQEETRISMGEETVIFRGTWRPGGNSNINRYLKKRRYPVEQKEASISRGTWKEGGNQDNQGYLENRRNPGYSGVPGEQEGIRISRGTWRTGGNHIYMHKIFKLMKKKNICFIILI